MAIKAIFFDFWGTLVENGVRSPTKEVKFILRLRDMDFSEYVIKFEEAFMTKKFESLKQAFQEVITSFNLAVPEFVIEKLIGLWNKNAILAMAYDETVEVLQALKKDYKLVLIANTDQFSIGNVLDKFELRQYFDEIALSCETGLLKSNSEAFEKILKKLKIKKTEAVMVGDSLESDIKAAENAGIKAILVDRHNKREYAEKIFNLNELKEKLS
jgi:HAD superfamily hydrolase (TIGR01549 family)